VVSAIAASRALALDRLRSSPANAGNRPPNHVAQARNLSVGEKAFTMISVARAIGSAKRRSIGVELASR